MFLCKEARMQFPLIHGYIGTKLRTFPSRGSAVSGACLLGGSFACLHRFEGLDGGTVF